MKTRGHIAVLVVISTLCLCVPTYAQEDGFSMPNVANEPTSNSSTAGENMRSGYTAEPVKKSTNRREVAKKDLTQKRPEDKQAEVKKQEQRPTNKTEKTSTPPKKSNEEGEDVLSFNLLYYMIQKFKFSDVIDE